MSNYYQTIIDGFAKKIAGISGSATWNDIEGYDYVGEAIIGPIAATITDGTAAAGSMQKALLADCVNQISTAYLTDNTTIGMAVVIPTTTSIAAVEFKITVRRQ